VREGSDWFSRPVHTKIEPTTQSSIKRFKRRHPIDHAPRVVLANRPQGNREQGEEIAGRPTVEGASTQKIKFTSSVTVEAVRERIWTLAAAAQRLNAVRNKVGRKERDAFACPMSGAGQNVVRRNIPGKCEGQPLSDILA
jgi:hypothetical protein